MEKAVLKTLIYADIFDYPMKIWEVHKWVIKNNLDLLQTEKVINRLIKKGKVQNFKEYYFLPNRKKIVNLRIKKNTQSKRLLHKAHFVSYIFKLIPWIKLVGISGGLAMENANKKDDIDLFIITSKNRLWISRLCMLAVVSILGLRRKSTDAKKNAAGKVCLNLILEEDMLAQQKKNLYTSHEVLQMKPLWQKGEIYSRYLEQNEWVFDFLPNWKSVMSFPRGKQSTRVILNSFQDLSKKNSRLRSNNKFLNFLNDIAYTLQIKKMGDPKGEEKISKGAVYFHPKDYGVEILNSFHGKK